MARSRKLILVIALLLLLVALPVAAQDATPEATEGEAPMELPPLPGTPLVTGLNHPRNFSFGSDGTLYIAEVGLGGDITIDTPEGPGTFGMSAEISVVAPDTNEAVVAISNLPSAGDVGVNAVIATDAAIYAVVGGAAPNIPMSSSVLVLDPQSYRIVNYIDVFSFEAENNPDGNEVDTNVTDIIEGDDGALYIVDAGGNGILRWTAEDGLSSFISWSDNPVPTSIDIGPDGNFYVSFLSPAPFVPGTSRIDVISPDGELVKTYGGLTMSTGVAVADDGTIYAVQFSGGLGEGGFQPGSVVIVSDDGVTPIAEGLTFPYGIAITPDGELAVSLVAAFIPAPEAGAIVVLPTE